MNRTFWLLGSMTAAALVAGCHHNNETGAASVAPKDTAQAQTSAGRAKSDSGYRTADTAAVKTRMNDSTKTDTSSMNRDTTSSSRNPSPAGAGMSDSMSMQHDSTGMKSDSTSSTNR